MKIAVDALLARLFAHEMQSKYDVMTKDLPIPVSYTHLHAQKIGFIEKPLYHYVNRPSSQSKLVEIQENFADKTFSIILGHNKMKKYLEEDVYKRQALR